MSTAEITIVRWRVFEYNVMMYRMAQALVSVTYTQISIHSEAMSCLYTAIIMSCIYSTGSKKDEMGITLDKSN